MRGLTILLCSLLFTVVAAQNSTSSGFSPEQDDSVASNSSSTSPEQPQCQICADGGNCSKAYKGGRGQYCYDWVDNLGTSRPCCCPTDAVCKPSTDECLCPHNGNHSAKSTDGNAFYDSKSDDGFGSIGDENGFFYRDSDDDDRSFGVSKDLEYGLVALGICIVMISSAICFSCCRRRSGNSNNGHPYVRHGGRTSTVYGGTGVVQLRMIGNNGRGGGGDKPGGGGGNCDGNR